MPFYEITIVKSSLCMWRFRKNKSLFPLIFRGFPYLAVGHVFLTPCNFLVNWLSFYPQRVVSKWSSYRPCKISCLVTDLLIYQLALLPSVNWHPSVPFPFRESFFLLVFLCLPIVLILLLPWLSHFLKSSTCVFISILLSMPYKKVYPHEMLLAFKEDIKSVCAV